jgi:hypothetical protein
MSILQITCEEGPGWPVIGLESQQKHKAAVKNKSKRHSDPTKQLKAAKAPVAV